MIPRKTSFGCFITVLDDIEKVNLVLEEQLIAKTELLAIFNVFLPFFPLSWKNANISKNNARDFGPVN